MNLDAAMQSIVGAEHVLVADDVRAGYETDWTTRYSGRCSMVVRPASTAEVSRVLSACNELGVSVIPQAGNTGLVGGGVPRSAEHDPARPVIVLSLRRIRGVSDVSVEAMALTAGAGVTIAEWQQAAREVGVDVPIDFAARDTATVGGAIATNAGGSRVVRFGTMRQQVLGIEAVLADGGVVGSLAGLPKETAGLHWPSVIAGSEGTLAIVTAARLRLVPRFAHTVTAMVSMAGVDDAVALAGRLRRQLTSLDTIEVITPAAMRLVADHVEWAAPVQVTEPGMVVIIECADHQDPTGDLVDTIAGAPGLIESAVATDAPRRAHLLAFRDRITEAVAATSTSIGVPTFKLDVAVALTEIERLLEVAHRAAADDGAQLIAFGHLAEGNLHLNYLGATRPSAIANGVLPSVAALGGTISAEHGIGIAKTPWLHLIRSPQDLAAQQAITRALDPNGILNPGVLLATERRVAGQVP